MFTIVAGSVIRFAEAHPQAARPLMRRMLVGGAAETGPGLTKALGAVILADVAYEVWKANKADDKKAEDKKDADALDGDATQEGEKKTSRKPTKGVKDAADEAATDENGNLICAYCGVEMTPEAGHENSREHDHKDAWVDTQDSSSENITDACRTCNRGKGRMSPLDFLKKLFGL